MVISGVSIIKSEKTYDCLKEIDLDIFHEIVDSSTSMAEYNTIQVQTFVRMERFFMMARQFNLWKKFLFVFFLLFSLPLSLTAQNSQLSSKTKAPLINAAGQPGNILMRPSLVGDLKFLFILVKFSNSSSGIISFNQAQEHANLLANAISINSYNRTSTTIDITSILTLPNSESFYQNNPLVRLRADAVKAAEQAGFDVDSYDREFIFSKKVWGTGALGTINRRTILMPHNIAYISAHEFGHTNGWRHANFFLVSSGSPISSNGTEI